MNFKNMSIRKSLIVGFGTTIVISVIIIVTALVMMTSQKNAYKDILDRYVASTDMIATCRIDYNIAARNLRDAVLSGSTGSVTTATEKLAELDAKFAELESIFPLSDRSTLTAFSNAIKDWEDEANDIAASAISDREGAVGMLVNDCTPKLNAAAAAGENAANALAAAQEQIINQQNLTSNIGLAIILGVMIIATIAVLLIAVRIIHSIVEPSTQVRAALVGFSQGNLSVPVTFTGTNPGPQIKERFSGKFCFKGGVEGTLLQFGSKDDVIQAVKNAIDIYAPGGGFILDCDVTVDVAKPENLHAFFDTARNYRKY